MINERVRRHLYSAARRRVLVHFEDAAARREVAYTLPQRKTLRLAAAARRSRVLV